MDILKVYEIINNKMRSWKNCFLNEAMLKKIILLRFKETSIIIFLWKNDKNIM